MLFGLIKTKKNKKKEELMKIAKAMGVRQDYAEICVNACVENKDLKISCNA